MARHVKGLTLLETLFSVFLVATVLLFLLELYPTTLLAERRAQQKQQAGNLAQSLVHDYLAPPFNQLQPGTETLDPTVIDGCEFSAQREVFAVDGANPDYVLGIRVVVSWQERGAQFSVTRELARANID